MLSLNGETHNPPPHCDSLRDRGEKGEKCVGKVILDYTALGLEKVEYIVTKVNTGSNYM